MAQAGPRALGDVDHRDRPGREQSADDVRRLLAVEVGREPVVDRHHALVGDDVPGDAAADGRPRSGPRGSEARRPPAPAARTRAARRGCRPPRGSRCGPSRRARCARASRPRSPRPAACPGSRLRSGPHSAPSARRNRRPAVPGRRGSAAAARCARPRPLRTRRTRRSRPGCGAGRWAARRSCTATPDFMSDVPQPYSRVPSARDGRFPATGTVSMCPARMTRSARPSSVRATIVWPSRLTVRCGSGRSAASMASASGPSSPLTEGMSTSCAVSAAPSGPGRDPSSQDRGPAQAGHGGFNGVNGVKRG